MSPFFYHHVFSTKLHQLVSDLSRAATNISDMSIVRIQREKKKEHPDNYGRIQNLDQSIKGNLSNEAIPNFVSHNFRQVKQRTGIIMFAGRKKRELDKVQRKNGGSLFDYILGMLRAIDGWHRFDAVSDMSTRSSVTATASGLLDYYILGVLRRLMVGVGLMHFQHVRKKQCCYNRTFLKQNTFLGVKELTLIQANP
ncbi:hypothetical protein KSS87_009264 [Heliosperma pusillum]|nr:hypothetical protein KSS87_009264 [Heliosperma pusillum]